MLAVTALLLMAAGPALAGDPVKGAAVLKRCMACHAIAAGGPNCVGPNLHGLTAIWASRRAFTIRAAPRALPEDGTIGSSTGG